MKPTSIFILFLTLVASQCFGQKMPRHYGKLETELFLGDVHNNSLVVAFGGSEGGNIFATEQTKEVRQEFHDRGFHFLSINYFGTSGLPKTIDRISLTAIYDTIVNVSNRLEILSSNIVLVGASRGGELVLNLASKYDFKGIIALVPSSVTVANVWNKSFTSSWNFDDEEIPFLDLNKQTVKKQGWSKAFEEALGNQNKSSLVYIPVEDINGFVFLSSGKKDSLWPSYSMCNYMIERLKENNFQHPYVHKAFDGGHNPSDHWLEVFTFIDEVMK